MTKLAFIAVGAGSLLLSACQVTEKPGNNTSSESAAAEPAAAPAAVDASAEDKAIRAQIDHWLQLIKAKDAAGIGALYTEDGAVMPPNAPIGKGRPAIEKAWAGMLAMPGFGLSFVPEEVVVSASGDMALDRGTYQLAMTGPSGAAMNDTGKYVVVWRKVGGQWLAAADIFNSDKPAS